MIVLFLREIAKIAGIMDKPDFAIKNWSKTCFHEMLKIAFEREFSTNIISDFTKNLVKF